MLCGLHSTAQTLSSPESIVLDEARNRFIISNAATGQLMSHSDAKGIQFFGSEAPGGHGLFIKDNRLFSCLKNRVFMYDLESDELLDEWRIEGARFLNGMHGDDAGNLFLSDFSGRTVYRVVVSESAFLSAEIFCKTPYIPNGVLIQESGLIVLTWGKQSHVLKYDLNGELILDVLTETSNLEAIYRDGAGDILVTSWTPPGIYRWTGQELIEARDIRLTHLKPTGIAEDGEGDLFVLGSESTRLPLSSRRAEDRAKPHIAHAFPNPMSVNSMLTFNMEEEGRVRVMLYDARGQMVRSLMDKECRAGEGQTIIKRAGLSSGLYFVIIDGPGVRETLPLTLMD